MLSAVMAMATAMGSRTPTRIRREGVGEDLERDLAVELGVGSLPDWALWLPGARPSVAASGQAVLATSWLAT